MTPLSSVSKLYTLPPCCLVATWVVGLTAMVLQCFAQLIFTWVASVMHYILLFSSSHGSSVPHHHKSFDDSIQYSRRENNHMTFIVVVVIIGLLLFISLLLCLLYKLYHRCVPVKRKPIYDLVLPVIWSTPWEYEANSVCTSSLKRKPTPLLLVVIRYRPSCGLWDSSL